MSQESFEQAIDLEGLDGSKRLGRRSFLVGALATGAAISAPVNYAAMARGRRRESPSGPSSTASSKPPRST